MICSNHLTTTAALEIASSRRSLKVTITKSSGKKPTWGFEISRLGIVIFYHDNLLESREGAVSQAGITLSMSADASRKLPGDLTTEDVCAFETALEKDDVVLGSSILEVLKI